MSETRKILIWDLPTRLFHWLLVLAIVALVVTGKAGGSWMEWHGRLGLLVLGLLVFRLLWGVMGSTYARFAGFFPTPAKVAAYLRGQWHAPGHNPLGACSVLALLAVPLFQALTGLVANDDIAFVGPLYDLVGRDLSNLATRWHLLAVNVLLALVALHVAAILFYAHIKKDNLVKPMVTGYKDLAPGETGVSATGGGIAAFIVALIVALGAVYAASGAWYSAPQAPVAQTTPTW